MFAQLLILSSLTAQVSHPEPMLNVPVPQRVTGSLFQKALETKVSASWENIELRAILNRLQNQYQTAVLLDRGINPNQTLNVDLNYQPLSAGLNQVAIEASARLSIVGNILYIGPINRMTKLRTLEVLRSEELEELLPKNQVQSLKRKTTVHWNDLDEPRQIVKELATRAEVAVQNLEAIPHDLWATGTLPDAAFTEALSLILIQYDLTFAWNADASQIRLVPVPETVAVERPYAPQGGPSQRASLGSWERYLNNASKLWEQQHPGMTCKADAEQHRLLISGTIEQHEALAGGNGAPPPNPADQKFPPLSKRLFTLKLKNTPASALLKKLEESGVKFQFDKAQLAAKNIDLDQPISLNVNKAKAEEFFRAICDPLGLKFRYSHLTVTLEPK